MALSGDDVCDLVELVEELAGCDAVRGTARDVLLARALGHDPIRLALIERARLDCAARRSPAHPGIAD